MTIPEILSAIGVLFVGIAFFMLARAFLRLAKAIDKQRRVEQKMMLWHLNNPPDVRQAKIDAEFEEVMERLREEHANE